MTNPNAFPPSSINVLLLEKISPSAAEIFREAEYNVREIPKALSEDELLEEIKDVHILCIRSKTKVSSKSIAAAKKLLAIGCFGVGTNQVDSEAACSAGIAVFNAPFASTRSVAELAMAGVLNLARRLGDCNNNLHQGRWEKSAKGSFEVRDKVLGIVGYGHIGQQVGLLAESLGIKVIFSDMMSRLPLGNARQVDSMETLLKEADFVTLHVPAQPGGKSLIGKEELYQMKAGSYILNLGRGSLVDIPALKEALESGQMAGAMLDVYPKEPGSNEEFNVELKGVKNVFLTPHIGGSTEEAQKNIGIEVAATLKKFVNNGQSHGSVNFPQVLLPSFPNTSRILNIHRNEPGVLGEITSLCSAAGANIDSQYLSTRSGIGYLIMDVSAEHSRDIAEKIKEKSFSIKTRVLY